MPSVNRRAPGSGEIARELNGRFVYGLRRSCFLCDSSILRASRSGSEVEDNRLVGSSCVILQAIRLEMGAFQNGADRTFCIQIRLRHSKKISDAGETRFDGEQNRFEAKSFRTADKRIH